ncbi:unnamed protein product, partial [Urochloa humidicola]
SSRAKRQEETRDEAGHAAAASPPGLPRSNPRRAPPPQWQEASSASSTSASSLPPPPPAGFPWAVYGACRSRGRSGRREEWERRRALSGGAGPSGGGGEVKRDRAAGSRGPLLRRRLKARVMPVTSVEVATAITSANRRPQGHAVAMAWRRLGIIDRSAKSAALVKRVQQLEEPLMGSLASLTGGTMGCRPSSLLRPLLTTTLVVTS